MPQRFFEEHTLQKPGVLSLGRHVIDYDSSKICIDHVTAYHLNEVVTNRETVDKKSIIFYK